MFQTKPPAERILEANKRFNQFHMMLICVSKQWPATHNSKKEKKNINNNLKCVIRAAVEKLSNSSSTDCKRWAERNSRGRKPDKHKICYDGHHLRGKTKSERCKIHSFLT
jgi:hypothetical protein